jgi:hypothetical protein
MTSVLLALTCFGAGGFVGVLLTAVACNTQRLRAEAAEDTVKSLRIWAYGADWPLGRIQSLVADCANIPVDKASVVIEVLRAFPSLARGLTRHETAPEKLADPVAAARWSKLVP